MVTKDKDSHGISDEVFNSNLEANELEWMIHSKHVQEKRFQTNVTTRKF